MSRKKIMLASARMAAWERGLPMPKGNIVSVQEPPHKKRDVPRRRLKLETAPFVETTPIPEVSVLNMAFGGAMKLLPKWEELTDEEKRYRGIYCEAASQLFFNGGKLEDHGIRPKPGVDRTKLYRWMKACLGDFAPSHEHKIGGVGHMLAKWCEPTK